ncbi:MAG TPA: OsmC family protein [Clostridia bacterium]|nr:OsmC family protein [Clostridia bacterium]
MAILKISSHAKSETNARTVVEARGFKMIIDEPENMGGSNIGANPVEYVLAALSGCLNVVGHLVAKEMGFELRGVEIDMVGELDPAKLMGQKTEKRAGFSKVNVTMTPDTDADEATKEKWLEEVEARCPVSDNLVNPTPINIILG